jgi:hypothetical protein
VGVTVRSSQCLVPLSLGIPAMGLTHHSCDRTNYRLPCGGLVVELLSILSMPALASSRTTLAITTFDCLVVRLLELAIDPTIDCSCSLFVYHSCSRFTVFDPCGSSSSCLYLLLSSLKRTSCSSLVAALSLSSAIDDSHCRSI